MSAFGAKRKARKITVQDDDDDDDNNNNNNNPLAHGSLNPPPETQEPALQATFKSRKPLKQSSLRKSINVNDEETSNTQASTNAATGIEGDQDDGAPLRVRPPLGRSASTKTKKRQSSSRLSFGPSEGNDDGESMILGDELSTPKKPSLAQTATENSAYKKATSKNLPLSRLPMRSLDADEDRPRYSKEYLSELQSSTPNTPQNLRPGPDDEAMSLDPSELDGAMIVDTEPLSDLGQTTVLTESEVREKKARRSRLAKQQGSRDTDDFISLSDDETNDRRQLGDSYLTVLSRASQPNSKSDTRLVAEDEDLGEGYDEFVEDGGLSLGKKAERAARKRQRAEMASLISAAEGAGSEGDGSATDDSEAERRAAYEAAQTRKGMDGLMEEREAQRRRMGEGIAQVPSRITPLPDLSVLVEEFKAKMKRKEDEVARMRIKIEQLTLEREGVLKREPEVQRLLNEAGERYRAVMMPSSGADGGPASVEQSLGPMDPRTSNVAAAMTLLDNVRGGPNTPGERGLDSLGTTPVKQSQLGDTI